jgi:hypothetical protein
LGVHLLDRKLKLPGTVNEFNRAQLTLKGADRVQARCGQQQPEREIGHGDLGAQTGEMPGKRHGSGPG